MSDKVTSAVDHDIKHEYEAMFEPGKAVYKEIFEEAMLTKIAEYNPIKACKLRIKHYTERLEIETKTLNELLEIEKRRNEALNPVLTELDIKRLEKFENKKEIYATQYKSGSSDWGKIAHALWLENAKEAMNYVIPRLLRENLIE